MTVCVCVVVGCVWGEGGGGTVLTSRLHNVLLHTSNPAGVYFQDPEITPAGHGMFRTNESGTEVDHFPPEVEVRAILESQIMAKFMHARSLGYQITGSSRVLATGGASQNPRILQVGISSEARDRQKSARPI